MGAGAAELLRLQRFSVEAGASPLKEEVVQYLPGAGEVAEEDFEPEGQEACY